MSAAVVTNKVSLSKLSSRADITAFANSSEYCADLKELNLNRLPRLTKLQREELDRANDYLKVAHENLAALRSTQDPEIESNLDKNRERLNSARSNLKLASKNCHAVISRVRDQNSDAANLAREIVRRERAIYRRLLQQEKRVIILSAKKVDPPTKIIVQHGQDEETQASTISTDSEQAEVKTDKGKTRLGTLLGLAAGALGLGGIFMCLARPKQTEVTLDPVAKVAQASPATQPSDNPSSGGQAASSDKNPDSSFATINLGSTDNSTTLAHFQLPAVGDLDRAPRGIQMIEQIFTSNSNGRNSLEIGFSSSNESYLAANYNLGSYELRLAALDPNDGPELFYLGSDLFKFGDALNGSVIHAALLLSENQASPFLQARSRYNKQFGSISADLRGSVSYVALDQNLEGDFTGPELFFASEGSVSTVLSTDPNNSESHFLAFQYGVNATLDQDPRYDYLRFIYKGEIAVLAEPEVPKDLYLSWYCGLASDPLFHPNSEDTLALELGLRTEGRYRNTYYSLGVDSLLPLYSDPDSSSSHNLKAFAESYVLLGEDRLTRLSLRAQYALEQASSLNSFFYPDNQNGISLTLSRSW